MPSIVARISMFVAALAATAAIGTSTALADPPYHTASIQSVATGSVTTPPPNLPPIDQSSVVRFRRVASYRSAGFDWSAAGIGALMGVAACVLLISVTFDVRRRRAPSVA